MNEPRSIYARMRDLIEVRSKEKDPLVHQHKGWMQRADEMHGVEQELLKYHREGYFTQDECLVALVRAVLDRAHFGFSFYRESWSPAAAASRFIEGDNSGTPVGELLKPPCLHPRAGRKAFDSTDDPMTDHWYCPDCKKTLTRKLEF